MVAICNRIRCICKLYFHSWKNWYFRVESNLGTAIRTGVVLIMAWIMVMITGKMHTIKETSKKELAFIVLSGLATGSSWLCYYKALQDGPASVVVPIDKAEYSCNGYIFLCNISRKTFVKKQVLDFFSL